MSRSHYRDTGLLQNLDHVLAAGSGQMVREKSPIADDEANVDAYCFLPLDISFWVKTNRVETTYENKEGSPPNSGVQIAEHHGMVRRDVEAVDAGSAE